MKLILVAILALSALPSFACSCMSTEQRLSYAISKTLKTKDIEVDPSSIKITDLNESFNVAYAMPNIIRANVTNDEALACRLSCSLKGVRITAKAFFDVDGDLCEAEIYKPARFTDKVTIGCIAFHKYPKKN